MTRIADILFSFLGLLFLSPIFLIVSLLILITSKGGVFFKQQRIGQFGISFELLKFRTMKPNSEKSGQLTIGEDNRITPIGKVLRKYKLDELPQLLNVLKGDMSFVGPRPEVEKYVKLYTAKQREVLKVKPGITDKASIHFSNENEILSKQTDPEKYYINTLMPLKLTYNLSYIENPSILNYFSIIFKTVLKVFGGNQN